MELETDSLKLTCLCQRDGIQDRRDQRPEMQHTVGGRADKNDSERKHRDVLLELKAAVHCDEGIVLAAHEL